MTLGYPHNENGPSHFVGFVNITIKKKNIAAHIHVLIRVMGKIFVVFDREILKTSS